jgi:glutathione S-transferase
VLYRFDDGSDYYTLPMLQDPSNGGRVIGDSFDIACYLEDTYPQAGGCLFPAESDASVGTVSTGSLLDSYESPHKDSVFYAPPLTPNASGSHAAYARFNTHVDTTFSAYVVRVCSQGLRGLREGGRLLAYCEKQQQEGAARGGSREGELHPHLLERVCALGIHGFGPLPASLPLSLIPARTPAARCPHTRPQVLVAHHMPFNPSTAAEVRSLFARRAHLTSWDQLNIQGEAREQLKAGFREGTASLAALFAVDDSGPYLAGSRASYADLIVGGWVNMMALTLPWEEWEEFRGWHGGVFGRLHDALRQSCWVCT